VEAPLKSEVFCSSLMHFWSAFGGAIWQVINGESSMVLYLVGFFVLFLCFSYLVSLLCFLCSQFFPPLQVGY